MAKIKTLKDYNNEPIYPQTVISAVYNLDNETLDMILNKKLDATLDDIPTTGSKNAVTSEGIKNYIDGLVGDIETLLASI